MEKITTVSEAISYLRKVCNRSKDGTCYAATCHARGTDEKASCAYSEIADILEHQCVEPNSERITAND